MINAVPVPLPVQTPTGPADIATTIPELAVPATVNELAYGALTGTCSVTVTDWGYFGVVAHALVVQVDEPAVLDDLTAKHVEVPADSPGHV